ncbi:MAG: hemin uptake protein HemP [Rhodoferax sp.]|uniref:hemin uptake protein HemP n=1 Tax=Rhodoferax sp. TaxID=50421 RepID=UPI0026091A2C|nr:hemin uptake protein HemP [Rhodoferax sp.]MDD2881826.1 hemin uptake protein HemP [Rhodoferax sp.]
MMALTKISKHGTATAPAPAVQRPTPEDGSMASPLPSSVLLKGQKSIAIEHQGSVYRLQVTKLGKLILTK